MQLPFDEISRWCKSYLELQYSADTGRHFSQLLKALGQIANAPRDGVDRFDWLKGREEEVTRELERLSDAFAAHLELQRHRTSRAVQHTTEEKRLLFVYGTLKRGHRRSAALAAERLVGNARTVARYRMFDCGGYPALVEDLHGVSIEGELWEVSGECLTRLDEIEGVQLNLYRRQPITLAAPYQDEPVDSYFYCRDTAGLVDCGVCWDDCRKS